MEKPFLVASVDVEGSILVMMMARCIGIVTVTSQFDWIRFRLAVRRLRGLCWASIVSGGCLLNRQPTYPLLITLVLSKDGVERAHRLAGGLQQSAAHCPLQRRGEWDHWLRLV